MTLWLVIALTARIAASSGASVLQKRLVQRGLSPFFVVAWSLLVLSTLLLPVILWQASKVPALSSDFWIAIATSAILDAGGNVLLVRALRTGELSIVGPLNSLKPLVGLLIGMLWIREFPSWLGLSGMLISLVGTWLLAATNRIQHSLPSPMDSEPTSNTAIRDRIGSVVLMAAASICLKSAIVSGGEVLAFCYWALGCTLTTWTTLFVLYAMGAISRPISSLASCPTESSVGALSTTATSNCSREGVGSRFRGKDVNVKETPSRENDSRPPNSPSDSISGRELLPATSTEKFMGQWTGPIVLLGCLFLVLQWMTVWLFARMSVGYALALFQLGSLVHVYLGWRYFHEQQLGRRLTASSIMALGAALILLAK